MADVITTCTHGMPSPRSCLTCMEDGPTEAPKRTAVERVATPPFDAKFEGHCGVCNLPIYPGERIVRTTTERYLHEVCAS